MGPTSSTDPILSIDKVGRWQFGAEHTLVKEGTQIQVDPFTMQHGYVCWKESKPVGEVLVPGMQPKPDPSKLPNHGVPWQEEYALYGRFLTGPDRGLVVIYKPSSMGGANVIKKLLADIYRQAEQDPTHLLPVLDLGAGSYQNKTYGGLTYYPIFTIVRWDPTPTDDCMDDLPADPVVAAEETTKTNGEANGRRRRNIA
jgi:hypothetical protein